MYTIGQAALRAGVSVPLLRAWERRYGIVRPQRTASGYRLYDEEAIDRLRSMRELIAAGWSPAQAARRIDDEGVLPSRDSSTEASPTSTARSLPADDLSAAYVEAAASMDDGRVEEVLDEILASGSFERAVDDRLMPALRALGEAWSSGDVSVAAEHAASHAVLRRLSAAFQASASPIGRPVLIGLPPGSRHELGALAFATAVRRRGIGVIYLGADVPLQSWVDAVRRSSARAVVVGAPTAQDLAGAEEIARTALAMGDVLVAIGGAAGVETTLPGVLALPDGIGTSARALEAALTSTGRRRRS
jgi:DNA-binding transcriptional MerR regulator/methylmalonyl-CoA mutase cobalamin-binding subunit